MRLSKPLLAAVLAVTSLGAASSEETRTIEGRYPEGPLWQGKRLYFAEMRADRITLVDPQGKRTFFRQRGCGPTSIAPYGEGFLVLCHLGARLVAVDAGGRELRRWQKDSAGVRLSNPNDASADGKGGVYFSDSGPFARTVKLHGWIMHLSANGTLRRVAGPLFYPNGVHVKGGVLYVSEHLGRRILRYGIEPDGALRGRQVFADLSHLLKATRWDTEYRLTGPDGLEFGPDGALYVALYGEGDLLRLSPEGDVIETVTTPTRFLTNVAFGDTRMALTGSFDEGPPPDRGEVTIRSFRENP